MKNDYLEELSWFFINKNEFDSNDTVLLGLSGGPDSVFLFYLLMQIQNEIGFKLNLIHINHKLRDMESDLDEEFVVSLAEKFDVPICVYRADIKSIAKDRKLSIEMCARDVRYAFFKEEAEKLNAKYIATAHTADDKIETALMRLIYGCGIQGVSGIKYKRHIGNAILIRPLLRYWKEDIVSYLKTNSIQYRVDSSNYSNEFIRNRIRNSLIPEIENSFNLSFKRTFLNSIELISEQAEIVKKYINSLRKRIFIRHDFIHICLKDSILKLESVLITQLIVDSIYILSKSSIRLSRSQFKSLVTSLFFRSSTVEFKFPGKICVVSDSRYIFISHQSVFDRFLKPCSFRYEISQGKRISVSGAIKIEVCFEDRIFCAYVAEDTCNLWYDLFSGKKIAFFVRFMYDPAKMKIFVRNRVAGDKIKIKSGMKKIKNFFIDERIPSILRNALPLICDQNDNILWVPGLKKAQIDSGGSTELTLGIYLKI